MQTSRISAIIKHFANASFQFNGNELLSPSWLIRSHRVANDQTQILYRNATIKFVWKLHHTRTKFGINFRFKHKLNYFVMHSPIWHNNIQTKCHMSYSIRRQRHSFSHCSARPFSLCFTIRASVAFVRCSIRSVFSSSSINYVQWSDNKFVILCEWSFYWWINIGFSLPSHASTSNVRLTYIFFPNLQLLILLQQYNNSNHYVIYSFSDE